MKKCWKQVLLFVMVAVAAICIGRTDAKAATIVETGSCGDSATYTLDSDGLLTISGSGGMKDGAFHNRNDIKKVVIQEKITEIGESAFWYCSSLTSIIMSDSITRIEDAAFFNCSSLENIIIPDRVDYIGDSAFQGCKKLTYIKIPKGVKEIRDTSFAECEALEKIEVATNNPVYDSRDNCNAIIKTANNELLLVGCKETAIPVGVTRIASGAFSNCKELTKIYIPQDIEYISSGAFGGCCSLKNIEVAGKNKNYDSRKNCNAIIETSINSLILGCQSTVIPNGVKSIGAAAFLEATNLTSINIPDSVTSIGEWAFENCSGLKNITIPNGVTSIEYGAFAGCSSLTSIIIPDSVTGIDMWAFSGCSRLVSITIPDSVTGIDMWAFSGCSRLVSITIPNGVTSIGEYAFEDCSSLTSITIPDSVTSIGESTFYGCARLISIIIPDCVVSIGNFAFGYEYNESLDKVVKIDGFTIYGTKGSAAETYAKENGFTFKTTGSTTELTSKNTTVKLSKTAFNFDGKAKKPTVKVLDTKGRTLKKSYYNVTYSNNVKVGKATATITFKGKYSGTIKKTFTIKPAKTTITGTSRKSDSVTLTWKKQKKEASGYQIQYATNRKFTKNAKTVTSKGIKKSSKKISGLSKKTTYYFRVRTYKTVNGKTYYSGWSKIETVKTK